LLSNGSGITNGSGNAESIFHRILFLIQQGFQLNEEASRKAVCEVMIDVLKLLSPKEEAVRNAVNNTYTLLNSPLHLWASIALKSPQDYTSFLTGEHTFKRFLQIILHHLLECGAKLNPRNANEQTPLHACRTWTTTKLLLDAGANPKDLDSSGQSPLLVVANEKNSIKKTDSFYADVIEDPETFWKSALEMGLDPWIADKQGESLLSVFIKSEVFVLAKALVEVACKEDYATNDVKLSLLNVISKDESKHTHWKTILVEVILNSARTSYLSLDSPLRFCCRNIVQFGMFDEKADSTQQKSNDEPSNDDGQPPPKKRRKDESVKAQEEEEPNEEHASYDSVHCKIAKQFLSYGGHIYIHDIVQDYPSLQNLLTEPIEIDTIPIRIPWTSVSDKSKGILAKVARRQECEMVDQIWYCKDYIASGAFGVIFAGINQNDGREVALKRIEKLGMKRRKDKREIKNLTALADCEQVVRYISFLEDEHFSYIVLELMEGNLDEYLDGSKIDVNQATDLCKHIVMGLEFLHRQNILHRDLKPANILYKVHPKTCLKIADFGLSHIIDSVSTTVYRTGAGTRCWISPEVLTSKPDGVNKDHFARASDMFSCGLLLHYILSGQKHPFYPADYANKGKLQLPSETEMNIVNGKMEAWDNSLPPEATDLVKRMLESNEKDRPSAEKALEHPLFWSKKEKVEFLKAVGNQKEFECPRSKKILPRTRPSRKRTVPLTPIETDLENGIKFKPNWNTFAWYGNTHAIHKVMMTGTGRKDYAISSAVDLVRFIRNVYEHFKEKTFGTPVPIEKMLFKDFAFFDDFPDLVMEVYKAVTTHGWDKTRDDVKFAMNKK
jgi:serine/threonine protein kinase/ankyrin repeat protein